jgi:hypothetical protein
VKQFRTWFLITEVRYREWKYRIAERFWTLIAWKLPDRLVYWTIIRAAVTEEKGHPGYVNALTMLRRFEGNYVRKEVNTQTRS